MAFVSVPKDLTKIKNKVVLNQTAAYLSCGCCGSGAAFLFPHEELYRDKQCGYGHGDFDAPGIFIRYV